MPEMTSAPARAVENGFSLPLYQKRDIILVRGEGVHLWDGDGKQYLDMMSNYGVAILGHAHPAVTDAIRSQAEVLVSCHQSFYNDARAGFLEALEALLPDNLRHVSFANSGAESVEAALKYARLATGRTKLIATKRGYHGRTFGALSVTGENRHRDAFQPLLESCSHVAYGDVEEARACIQDAAAIILEPIQGESGVRAATSEYLRGLRAACDETGTLLIFDEVQTAFRTGRNWAFEHSGVVPDIMTLSKPLANGLPIGVTVVSQRVAERVTPGVHGSTFAGNPLVCAAATAVLRTVGTADFNRHVAEMGDYFIGRLRSLPSTQIREVRGVGLMVAVELKSTVSSVLKAMQQNGVLAIPAGKTVVRFLPPLIVQSEHIDQTVEVFEHVLSA